MSRLALGEGVVLHSSFQGTGVEDERDEGLIGGDERDQVVHLAPELSFAVPLVVPLVEPPRVLK